MAARTTALAPATGHSSTAATPGQNGQQAFNLDGQDDYVTIPSTAAAQVTGAISASAWIKPTSLPSGASDVSADIFGQYDTHDTATSFDMWLTQAGQIAWGVTGPSCDWLGGGASAVQTTTGIPVGQWTQVAGTFAPSTEQLHILINGQVAATQKLYSATVSSLCSTGSPLRIGAAEALGGELADFFNGEIQDVKLLQPRHQRAV
jgi:hypothetical protein